MAWLQRIVDWQQETIDPLEFLETLKLDLEQDEVYVFTPKGKVIALAAGSTPIDFAYAIHTEVGPPLHRGQGERPSGPARHAAAVGGHRRRSSPPRCPRPGPSRDWLQIVASPRARNKIRQWFSRERREDAMETGREELIKALRREGLPVQKLAASNALERLAAAMNYTDLDALHAAIGDGHVSARSVAQRLARDLRGGGRRGAAAHHGGARARAPAPGGGRRSASTSRASTTSWCGCRAAARRCRATRSSAS